MRWPSFLLLMLLPLPWASAIAADQENGKRLHDRQCTSCHTERYGGDGSQIYLRANRLVHSLPALEQRVATCNKMTRAGLSPDDEKDVSAYLAQHYYKFSPSSGPERH